jgi:hypothetical protein
MEVGRVWDYGASWSGERVRKWGGKEMKEKVGTEGSTLFRNLNFLVK